jgi:hypothetical protein
MNHLKFSTFRRPTVPGLGLAALLVSGLARAAEEPGWSLNLTPVLLLPKDDYRVGGGTDPELKYSRDHAAGASRIEAWIPLVRVDDVDRPLSSSGNYLARSS